MAVKKGRTVPKGDINARWTVIGDSLLLTGEAGEFAFLSRGEFDSLVKGRLPADSDLYRGLKEKGLVDAIPPIGEMAARYRKKYRYNFEGPHLHILITTLRCNQACIYCHASRVGERRRGFDMLPATAKEGVDIAFSSPSPSLNFEFQGGEPLLNFDAIRFVIDYAREKNRFEKKRVSFSLVSNLSLMNERYLKTLLAEDIYICTSLDGPEEIHNAARPMRGGNSYKETVRWIDTINKRYREMGLDNDLFHVDAIMTTTSRSLPSFKEIVDEYVERGIKVIYIRPLNPLGVAMGKWKEIGYTKEAYLDFYLSALEYIIELNLKGVEILEKTASIFLTKILTDVDPGFTDIRSPCGAGVGQMAYNYDGRVFTCDEGRMLCQMGDDLFQIGDVESCGLKELLSSESLYAIMVSSILDTLPLCHECAFKPYCGVCPALNYALSGDLFGSRPKDFRCHLFRGIMKFLFSRLREGDKSILDIFKKWIKIKERNI